MTRRTIMNDFEELEWQIETLNTLDSVEPQHSRLTLTALSCGRYWLVADFICWFLLSAETQTGILGSRLKPPRKRIVFLETKLERCNIAEQITRRESNVITITMIFYSTEEILFLKRDSLDECCPWNLSLSSSFFFSKSDWQRYRFSNWENKNVAHLYNDLLFLFWCCVSLHRQHCLDYIFVGRSAYIKSYFSNTRMNSPSFCARMPEESVRAVLSLRARARRSNRETRSHLL